MPHEIIDLDRYPVADLQTPGAGALVAECRERLAREGICVLEDFVPPAALASMRDDATACFGDGHKRVNERSVYLLTRDEPDLPEGHPRRRMLRANSTIAPCDVIPQDSAMRHFYNSDLVRRFCAAVLGIETLYPNECPYQALNVIYFDDGDYLAWHFDADNAFTINVLLEDAEQGGVFEVAPGVRSRTEQNYDEVARVLDGTSDRLARYVHRPGSLIIFRSQDSLHRVTPVRGGRRRMIMVMCYEERPGVGGDPRVNATIYGPRVAAKLGMAAAPGA